MATIIEELYTDLKDAAGITAQHSMSAGIALEDVARKYFTIAAASYFEKRVLTLLTAAVEVLCPNSTAITNLIEAKAFKRQYHTLFDWDSGKANLFFSLFGKEFKEHMIAIVTKDSRLSSSISSFLELGSYRNQLAHSDCTSFQYNKTLDEIFVLYTDATFFVEEFPQFLLDFHNQ